MERLKSKAKQNMVNIRLELIKDKSYDNFTIVAHFDSKAPNVLVDKNEYLWIPTIEEKELLNDAFNFLSTKTTVKQAEAKEAERNVPLPEKIPPEKPIYEKISQKYTKPEEKPEELLPLEKEEEEEPSIFEATEEKTTSEDLDTGQSKEEPMDARVDITSGEYEEERQTEEKKDEDEGIIVEADAETIEAALKKQAVKDDEDSNLVEADEQTIIDKVLSQKKKGKWSRK